MIITNFRNGGSYIVAYGLWQYDYGQKLRIQGLDLPTAVEIHFSLQETGGESVTRVGVTKDGVTDVVIPDSMLEANGTVSDYKIYAFIYLTDDTSGETIRKIIMPVKSRPKPEAFDTPEDAELFREAIAAVNEAVANAGKELVPTIGENGNWFINGVDTGMSSQGEDGVDGKDGKSAYAYAQDGGYTGTEEEFAQLMATGTGNGSSGVSSWNELKDRPFGEEEVLLVSERTVTNSASDGLTELNSTIVSAGQELVVYFDSERYVCTVEDTGDTLIAGRTETALGYPFTLVIATTRTIVGTEDDEEHTISVYTLETKMMDPRYIPDMYYTEESTVEVLTECNPTFVENSGTFVITDAFLVMGGQEYIVKWNGVEYKCNSQELDGGVSIGNMSATGGADTGEPFGFIALPPAEAASVGVYAEGIALDGSTTATLSISKKTEVVHLIPEKYIEKLEVEITQTGINTDHEQATYSCNKSFEDVYEAIQNNIPVRCKIGTSISNMINYIEEDGINVIVFIFIASNSYALKEDNTVSLL